MATLGELKRALSLKAQSSGPYPKEPLTNSQYCAGFELFRSGSRTYQDFIIPQLFQIVDPVFKSRTNISVLEIGPGPESVLGHLPANLRHKIKSYTALEPNELFATALEEALLPTSEGDSPLPCLEGRANIQRTSFSLHSDINLNSSFGVTTAHNDFDLILFCHSMYGMKPERKVIENALQKLVHPPEDGMLVIVHRDEDLNLAGLASHRTVSFPTGAIGVPDKDQVIDRFAPFIAGFTVRDQDTNSALQVEWRQVCRALGRRHESQPDYLWFGEPDIITAFTRHATALPRLNELMPAASGRPRIKNREARPDQAASIVRPTTIGHVQNCVRWALQNGMSLTVIGGGHSGHCVWPNTVAVDMSGFDKVHIVNPHKEEEMPESDHNSTEADPSSLVVAGAGCRTIDIVQKSMAAGLTVPLGTRPSVGSGLWLQGGIGHLSRKHGLTCDAIVGAVMVSVATGQIFCIGRVPSQFQPADAVRPENDKDILWAIKGAGTNFGIVVSVTFRAYADTTYVVRNWVIPLSDDVEGRAKLGDFNNLIASKLPRNFSADAYMYWETEKLHLGVTVFECSVTGPVIENPTTRPPDLDAVLGPETSSQAVDGLGLFETEMHISEMHGGHVSGKTSSFKRCLFLRHIGGADVADVLITAIQTRPSPRCYVHLLHGRGAIADVNVATTAFGCRGWDFACVVTGVWPRGLDGTEVARAAVQWVYDVVENLLPLSNGAYGADLGPDPRDAVLATKAFGQNRPRLARLKRSLDPYNVLAYACPLPKSPMEPKLIFLVTGQSCAGKDYCANVWVSSFTCNRKNLIVRTVSISDTTKAEYAAAYDVDLSRLLQDRDYKEQHRSALTAYFQDQVRRRPQLPEEQFLRVVYGAADSDVLFITGLREEDPVAALAHLVPDSKLFEVHIKACPETRQLRRGGPRNDVCSKKSDNYNFNNSSLVFENDGIGDDAVRRYCELYLLPFVDTDLQRLARMVRPISNFPHHGIEFRHVLDIAQQPGGLALCTSLLRSHFRGDWSTVEALVCCEVGGFVFASPLAAQINLPLALVRAAGKLPLPIVSTVKCPSHISSSASKNETQAMVEMGRDVVPKGASVLVIDDVLASGNTLCAVLQLLRQAGVHPEDVSIMVVAEFPVHRGRRLLRQRGFGQAKVQSLLVFGGA